MNRNRIHHAFQSLVIAAILLLILGGCGKNDPSNATLSAEDRARIEAEVRQALDDYGASVIAGDMKKITEFWGDFDDFIHAGDGRVFGEREKWVKWIAENMPDETISWEYSDVHVAVLGPSAASYTANFEVVWVVDGEEATTTGSWTYVMRKTDDDWRVVHSNGKHNEFSYYDETN